MAAHRCVHYAPTVRPLRAHYVFQPVWGETDGPLMCPRLLCAHYAAPTMCVLPEWWETDGSQMRPLYAAAHCVFEPVWGETDGP